MNLTGKGRGGVGLGRVNVNVEDFKEGGKEA